MVWRLFGGRVNANGSRITLLTDKSTFVVAQMIRDHGTLTGLQVQRHIPLKHADESNFKDADADSEGLAIGRDGAIYLSFERVTRVVRLSPETGATRVLPLHPDFATYGLNKGLEALAIHPNGTLYTLPERSASRRTAFPLFAFAAGRWRVAYNIPRRGPFLTVGADFDSAGRLYLLERAVSPLGFRSRIRRFDLDAADLGETTLLTTGPGRFDNLEALSVWQDRAGTRHLTLISDDNFLSIQRTQIVEFTLTE